MFFYATSEKFKHNLTIVKLSDNRNEAWIDQIAQWMEKKWGYFRGFPGVAFRREQITKDLMNDLYVLTYANQIIGMFILRNYESFNKNITAKELMSVYIEDSFRGLGLGTQVIKRAKAICQDAGAEMMIFETLNPNLNHFYEKNGANVICDSRFLKEPTSLLRIKLK